MGRTVGSIERRAPLSREHLVAARAQAIAYAPELFAQSVACRAARVSFAAGVKVTALHRRCRRSVGVACA